MPYRFSTRAQVEGPAIPSTSFEAAGVVNQTGVVLDRFDGYALRGRINGRGALSWTGNQAWNFDVDAQGLAISELRPGVEGRVSAKGTIAGTGLSAAAPWTARLTSLSGTMFGRPLTGRGEVAHRDGVFDLKDVRIANGTSFADVDGRVGTNVLDLSWNVDLRSLAVAVPGMTGTLVSRGTARGTPARPVVAGTARLRHFDYAGVQVANFDAEADVDSSDKRRSSIAFSASTIDAAGLVFDFARGSLNGFVGDHKITLDFASPGDPERRITEFSGEFVAEGGYDLARNQWAGDLSQGRDSISRRRCTPDPAGGAGARSVAAALGAAVPAHGPGRATVRRGRASSAAAFVACDLQRGGLAAAARPALAARLARVRRSTAGQRLGGESAGQGVGWRDDAARARADDQRAAQQVSRRTHQARQQPLRPAGGADADSRDARHRRRRFHADRGRSTGEASPGCSTRLDADRAHQGHVRSNQGAAPAGAGDRSCSRPARRQRHAWRHARTADVQWRLPGARRRAGALSNQPQDHGTAGRWRVQRR